MLILWRDYLKYVSKTLNSNKNVSKAKIYPCTFVSWNVFDTVWCFWYGFVVFSIQTKILSLHFCQLKRFWYVFDAVWCFWYVFVTSIEHIWDGFETLLCWFFVNTIKTVPNTYQNSTQNRIKMSRWSKSDFVTFILYKNVSKFFWYVFDAFLMRFWYGVIVLIRFCGFFDTN